VTATVTKATLREWIEKQRKRFPSPHAGPWVKAYLRALANLERFLRT